MQYMLQEILAAKLRSSHQRCSAKEVLFCESSKKPFLTEHLCWLLLQTEKCT